MRRYLTLLVFWIAFGPASGQEDPNRFYFSISYFGILGTHPGLKVGVQRPLVNLGSADTDQRRDQLFGSANLIVYFHRRHQLGLGCTAEVGFRNRVAGGTNKEIALGIGYLRTFLPNRMYDFDVNDPPSVRRFRGAGHFLKLGSVGLGGNRGGDLNGSFWMIKPTLFHIRPFNTRSTFNFALDAGYYFLP